MCQVRDSQPWDRNTTWAVRFFVLILSVAVLSTIYDRSTKNQQKQSKFDANIPPHLLLISGFRSADEWCTAFSLDKNLRWLFSTNSSPGDIEAVHGIRFLNAVMLIFSHKSMAMFFNPYNNRTTMAESLGQPWTVIGRAASLYTDPFLLFSGMLTSYSLFGRLMKQQPIRLKNEYISRLMRWVERYPTIVSYLLLFLSLPCSIVPPLAALILFCTYVLPLWGSGPQWNLVVGHHADICKQHWWRNLLFIHNYFGFSEMCLTHTHHLGIDTELFAVAPIFILALWRWPRRGLFALLLLCTVGTAARYYTTIVNQLSNYIYFGTKCVQWHILLCMIQLIPVFPFQHSAPVPHCRLHVLVPTTPLHGVHHGHLAGLCAAQVPGCPAEPTAAAPRMAGGNNLRARIGAGPSANGWHQLRLQLDTRGHLCCLCAHCLVPVLLVDCLCLTQWLQEWVLQRITLQLIPTMQLPSLCRQGDEDVLLAGLPGVHKAVVCHLLDAVPRLLLQCRTQASCASLL